MEKMLTYDPKKKKYVSAGEFDGKRFYSVKKAKHFHRITQSYAMQEDVIAKLVEGDCQEVFLKTPTGVLVSKFKDWLSPDIKVLDYGHGKQRFMPIKRLAKRTKRGE